MAKKKVFNIGNALSTGLEETITAAHNYSGNLRVDIIPITKIETDPENPRDLSITLDDLRNGISATDSDIVRKTKEKSSLETLAASIKDQGLINPIVVYKNGEKYRLIAGERRSLASIIAGCSDIQAKILDVKPTPLKISVLQWIENIERTDLTLWEKLMNLEKIISVFSKTKGLNPVEITITELSTLIGCSKPHAMNYKSVIFGDNSIKEMIKENKLKNLEKAALLTSIQSAEVRENAIDACVNGANLKKLKMISTLGTKKTQNKIVHTDNERRGRQAKSVNFGATKDIDVAKIIVNSVLKNESLSHLSKYFDDIKLDNFKSITDTFKLLIKKLEELHAK